MSNKVYLIRWPNAVSLDVPPTGHLQSGSILAVIFGNNDAVRCDRSVLFAEVVFPKSDLNCRATFTDLGRYHLRGWLRRC